MTTEIKVTVEVEWTETKTGNVEWVIDAKEYDEWRGAQPSSPDTLRRYLKADRWIDDDLMGAANEITARKGWTQDDAELHIGRVEVAS